MKMIDSPNDVAEMAAILSRSADDASQRAADLLERQARELQQQDVVLNANMDSNDKLQQRIEQLKEGIRQLEEGILYQQNKQYIKRIKNLESRRFYFDKSTAAEILQLMEISYGEGIGPDVGHLFKYIKKEYPELARDYKFLEPKK